MEKELNKKLIKQLEGVGFERKYLNDIFYQIEPKVDYLFSFHNTTEGKFFCYFKKEYIEGKKCVYIAPTFPQILAAIKEHTGVDLQPKKTKREEIEELKAQVTHLSEWMKTTSTLVQDCEDYKRRIEQLEKSTKGLHLEFKFDDKGKIAKVHENETILSNAADHLKPCGMVTATFQEGKPEPQPFKVGDRVVIKKDATFSTFGDTYGMRFARDNATVLFFVKDDVKKGVNCQLARLGSDTYIFELDELEHAPKELKFGDPCVITIVSEAAEKEGYKAGDEVLYLGKGFGIGLVRYVKNEHTVRVTGKENLKPL